ncbi:hypothetical protein [Nocardia brasiliensis]|uniref:hypothetical protein n=1 Tax=Nocardia brasiliensis TaxID=37326 RepID=UPI00366D3AA2
MGFIIWYKLEFRAGTAAPTPLLRLSNDVLHGDLLLDAAVRTKATLGPHATTFEITLWDLPLDEAERLAEQSRSRAGSGDPLLVDLGLGYFDQPSTQLRPVLRGAVTDIRTEVAADGSLLTHLKGTELGGYHLLRQRFSYHRPGESTLAQILAAVAAETTVQILHDGVTGTDKDVTIADGTALSALGQLAAEAGAPLAVRNEKAVLGTLSDPAPPAVFRNADNIVDRRRWDSGSPDLRAAPGTTTRYELTVLGDPALQIGARVSLDGLETHDLRVESVQHLFSLRSGYTCAVTVLDAGSAGRAEAVSGPHAVIDGLHALTRGVLAGHPDVDVGDIAGYRKTGEGDNGGHRATLRYGQQPSASSVDDPVDNRLMLHDKPLASVFAWDRTGLMVPVYPGMRSLLVHNGGAVNDAIAAGFLWSRHANHVPPKNEAGDYWLCLPTAVSDGRPEGKGANDLTDAGGHRVVQSVGLAIEVGTEVLPEVGERPTPPTAQTLTIKHGKGTTITVAEDGSVDITTEGKDLTFGNGKASIAISGGEITMTADSIKLAATSVEVG